MTIEQARKEGFKVRVGHFRFPDKIMEVPIYKIVNLFKKENVYNMTVLDSQVSGPFAARGGATTVEISKDGKDTFGNAFCSIKDNYNRKVGAELALARALEVWNSLPVR